MRIPRERLVLGVVLFLALVLVVPGFLPDTGPLELVRRVLRHPFILAAGIAAIWVLVSLWQKQRRKEVVLLTLAILAAGSVFGVRKLRVWFPRHQLFSPGAYANAARLLLGRDILLSDFDPRPELEPHNPEVPRARYPAVDVHFHLGSLDSAVTPERLIAAMDSVGIETIVNLDGFPPDFEKFREWYERYPGRFVGFAMPQFWLIDQPFFRAEQEKWLLRAADEGARGIKIPKAFGMGFRDSTGAIIPVDDPRFDFVWDLAGKLGFPVLIHTADPPPFFRPADRFNERYLELKDNPQWSYAGGGLKLDSLYAQRERLLRKHPHTNFIAAHVAMAVDDLDYVGHLFDTYPNFYVDMSSQLMGLGRQPRAAREFFLKYADRILFGTDGGYALDRSGWPIERFYRTHYQFLETDADYFDYPLADITKQGGWKIYGLALPDSVLALVYSGNARRLIPSRDTVVARAARLRAEQQTAAGSDDATCAGQPFFWARSGTDRPSPTGDDSAAAGQPDFRGDSVRVTRYAFRPGRPRQMLGAGYVENRSGATIELRSYRIEFLGADGSVAGVGTCRVERSKEQCGLGPRLLRRPGYVSLSADTLPPVPEGARRDTARVFWTYCLRP
jgi:predicted TIM-barrel fold metal-dependent hydrolase